MKQSDSRGPGRARPAVPDSFGRRAQEETPEPEDFQVIGGQLIVQIDLTPSEKSLEAWYQAIKETTARAIRDGYAEAVGEPPPGPAEPPQ